MSRHARTLGLLLFVSACSTPGGGVCADTEPLDGSVLGGEKNRAVDQDDADDADGHAAPQKDLGPPLRFVPTTDANAHLMGRIDVEAVQAATFDRPSYYDEPVPRLVHRVLGPTEDVGAWPEYEAWHSYCDAMGFELVQWQPSAAAQAVPLASSVRAQALMAAHAAGRHDVAVQLSALSVLAKHGGFVIGPRVLPPSQLDCAFDLQDMGNRQGLTIATNLRARRVGGWSVYLTTALMVAPPGHPWVVAAAQGAAANTLALLQGPHAQLPGRYFAGNAYLSRNLAGIFSVLPYTYLQELGMFPELDDRCSGEDALE